jgi:aspartate 1-decarboxylase
MFKISVLKSKVHRAVITHAFISEHGGLTLDKSLMEAADLLEYEKIQVVNVNNGERFETYLRSGEAGSGICALGGPDARRGITGDIVILISYAQMRKEEAQVYKPRVVFPKNGNIC